MVRVSGLCGDTMPAEGYTGGASYCMRWEEGGGDSGALLNHAGAGWKFPQLCCAVS